MTLISIVIHAIALNNGGFLVLANRLCANRRFDDNVIFCRIRIDVDALVGSYVIFSNIQFIEYTYSIRSGSGNHENILVGIEREFS